MARLAASHVAVHAGDAAGPVGAARARVSARRGALLTLTDDRGAWGQGEASPLPGYSREALDAVLSTLADVHARFDEGALDDPLRALAAPWVGALPGSARFAVETALCDLAARRRGVPLHVLLAGRAASAFVPVNAYAGAALDAGLLDAASDALVRGVTTVKVKLTGAEADFAREVEALVALRRALPGAWRLRLDLNGAWRVAEATPERFASLARCAPEFVEQPVVVGALRALGWRQLPWAIDESLEDPDDLAYALARRQSGGCCAAVIKPAVHGLLGALDLGRRAHAAGLGVVVTHLFDGPVALAAACELALSLPAPWACGLDRHAGLAAWPAVDVPQREDPRFITPARGPGLGLARLDAAVPR